MAHGVVLAGGLVSQASVTCQDQRVDLGDVVELLDVLDGLHVRYWLDGGWGVDCLLGQQTRPHSDLDLVVQRREVDLIRFVLAARDFDVIRDWLPTTLALRDAAGREVDLHPIDPSGDGGGDQVLIDGTVWRYAPPTLGALNSRPVPCASAEAQLAMHQGYEQRPIDQVDVARLVRHFGLPWPPGYGPASGRDRQ